MVEIVQFQLLKFCVLVNQDIYNLHNFQIFKLHIILNIYSSLRKYTSLLLYKIFYNFVSNVTRYEYLRRYIQQMIILAKLKSENVYKITRYSLQAYAEFTKIFEQTIIRYISKTENSVTPCSALIITCV